VDVLLFSTPDGGNINCKNGTVETTEDGLASAGYLSLFGGNEDDTGSDGDKPKQWWGNVDETDPTRRYRCETQGLIHALPAVPENLKRIEDAAERDLAWFMETGIASAIAVEARMPGVNRIRIEILIVVQGVEFRMVFERDWQATQ
jgi:phage gp46-like protein